MLAGRLDQEITLQTASMARDGTYSAAAVTYSNFATVWAEVRFRTLANPEPVIAGQKQSTLRATFRIRYLPGVTSTMRINHGGRYYQVLDWNVIGRNEEIYINAVEWNEGRR